jgi:hypothetical protein
MAFAGLVRDCAAIAVGATAADIFPFQTGQFYRLPAAAFAGVALAEFATAIRAAPAKNPGVLLDGQYMHRRKLGAAFAFAGFVGHEIALAVIFAVADIIGLALVRRNQHAD